MKQLIETVEELEAREIAFISITESIDTSTPGGKLIFHIFASLAEFERAIIRERTMAGLLAAKEKGKFGGRPKRMTENDLTVARALLADSSIKISEIAKRLKISQATLYRYFPGGRAEIMR